VTVAATTFIVAIAATPLKLACASACKGSRGSAASSAT